MPNNSLYCTTFPTTPFLFRCQNRSANVFSRQKSIIIRFRQICPSGGSNKVGGYISTRSLKEQWKGHFVQVLEVEIEFLWSWLRCREREKRKGYFELLKLTRSIQCLKPWPEMCQCSMRLSGNIQLCCRCSNIWSYDQIYNHMSPSTNYRMFKPDKKPFELPSKCLAHKTAVWKISYFYQFYIWQFEEKIPVDQKIETRGDDEGEVWYVGQHL